MTIPVLSILGFVAFALIHSLLARRKVKGYLFEKLPALSAFYRIIYVAVAIITLILWWWLIPIPDMQTILYAASSPDYWLLRIVQIAALYGFVKALRNSGTGTFLGIRQVKTYMAHGTLPDDYDEYSSESLHKKGSYKYMRHPLYTYSILLMAANPVMSLRWAYLTAIFFLYFWLGSYFEEKGLIRKFGDRYRNYQEEVPRFIPRLKSLKQLFTNR